MLKPQDLVVLLKLLADSRYLNWTQNELATHLCLSQSAVNSSLIRLQKSKLLNLGAIQTRYKPIIDACEEVLIYGVKYFIPAYVGEFTAGIATSYAAPIFEGKISLGQDPIPVWPSAEGKIKGVALEPLYHCVPVSIIRYPDKAFYDLLALVDAIRQGRTRERNLAVNLLKEKLRSEAEKNGCGAGDGTGFGMGSGSGAGFGDGSGIG